MSRGSGNTRDVPDRIDQKVGNADARAIFGNLPVVILKDCGITPSADDARLLKRDREAFKRHIPRMESARMRLDVMEVDPQTDEARCILP
jgi:hypothetical protein